MQAIRSPSGFSLIEVVTVMGIMGVLCAIAMPAMNTLRQKASLVSAQREVMSALYRTRSAAIASNAPRRVVFSPPASIQVTDSSGTTTYYAENLVASNSDISIVGGTPITVIYDARGLLNPPATATVMLQDSDGQSKTVTVYPTGKQTAN